MMQQTQQLDSTGLDAPDNDALRGVPLLATLDSEQFSSLVSTGHRRRCARGELIVTGDPEDSLHIVLSGRVRLYLLSPEGREFTLRHCRPGDLFHLCAGGDGASGEAVAQALDHDTTVYALPWSAVADALAAHPGAALELIERLRADLLEERRLIGALTFQNARARLASRLLELASHRPSHAFRQTREALAAAIGSRPEEVTKALRDFKALGLVDYPPYGRLITIVDPDGLHAYVRS
jgi:CRP/FNR family cyclic AMP-dependent transcriptional regulator